MKKRKVDVGKSSHIANERGRAKKKKKLYVGECSHIATEHGSSEGIGVEPILELKHKIFLSHSGVQKEFVEHLCKALEDQYYYPFFDRRPRSLPKGKQFPGLIIKAAQQCQLLVVVVSEEYFMSKWPMIELNAFIQASKVSKSNVNVAILPLFYGLSVNELKDKKRRQRWLRKWKTFAKGEGRIKVEDWCFAVDELTKFNGLSYDRDLKGIVAYTNEIVSHIRKLVLPDIKWYDLHVQGNACEVLLDKMKQMELSQIYKVKVVGIYGVDGIGKTTTCKTLCNKLSNEYQGRVCHIEFESTCSNSKELLQDVVINLIRQDADVRQLDEGKCKHILHENLRKHGTFLAIDNVSDNSNSIKHAQMFLDFPSHKDSLVLVTAQSQSPLVLLGIRGDACLEMPELEEADATSLFLYYAAPREEFTSKEDINSIKWCVERCYFCKGDERGYHFYYHPSALEALGRHLRGSKPREWEQRLFELYMESKKEDFWARLGVDYPPPINAITSSEEIKWQYFSNVLILQLNGSNSLYKNLNLKDITYFQSLQIYKFQHLERLKGLESSKHLTLFEWEIPYSPNGVMETHVVGLFPAFLKYHNIEQQCVLSKSNVLTCCNNFIKLKLGGEEVGILLDLNNYLSLEIAKIYDTINLQAVLVSITTRSSRLYTLDILDIDGLHILRLERLDGFVRLSKVERCDTTWEVPCLLSLTKLQKLRINTHTKFAEQCTVRELQEFFYDICIQNKVLYWNAFKQLQVLDLSWSHSAIEMDGMNGLPTLQSLNLCHCVFLKQLPDLSKSKSLRELNLKGCNGLQLYVEDFETLAKLPLLRLVLFSNKSKQKKNKLDTTGKKVLQYLGPTFDAQNSWLAWKEGELEELEFGPLPIKIGNSSNCDPHISIESDVEELEITESNIEELNSIDSNEDNIVFDTENILKIHDTKHMTQGNSDLDILGSPFNCSVLFWFVVDYIKQFWIA